MQYHNFNNLFLLFLLLYLYHLKSILGTVYYYWLFYAINCRSIEIIQHCGLKFNFNLINFRKFSFLNSHVWGKCNLCSLLHCLKMTTLKCRESTSYISVASSGFGSLAMSLMQSVINPGGTKKCKKIIYSPIIYWKINIWFWYFINDNLHDPLPSPLSLPWSTSFQ